MSSASVRLSLIAVCYCAVHYCAIRGLAQPPTAQLNPTVKKIVEEVSEERIGAIMKKLGDFGTRYVGSETDNPTHGIGAATKFIEGEFKSYSPRLQVSLQPFNVPKTQRTPKDLDLLNVVAVLPGTIDKDRYVIISGHYDSIALRRPTNGAVRTDDAGPASAADADPLAPGVADDGSGTAATMELARVMSQYTFDKSIVFITFAAEEIGLNGSKAYAAKAKEDKMEIEGVLNNDIIGSDVSGNGMSANNHLRVFSEGPEDSIAVAGTLHQGDRRAVYAVDDRGPDFPPRSLRPRRRSHFLRRAGLRCGPAYYAEREFRQPAHRYRYFRQRVRALHHASCEDQRRGAGDAGAGAEASCGRGESPGGWTRRRAWSGCGGRCGGRSRRRHCRGGRGWRRTGARRSRRWSGRGSRR